MKCHLIQPARACYHAVGTEALTPNTNPDLKVSLLCRTVLREGAAIPWWDSRMPLHRQKTEQDLDPDIQDWRIADEERNAITHDYACVIMLVQHSKIPLTSSRLIAQLPYHLSRPRGLTPDGSSHIHMYTNVLYHTARV
jgi:hypothetical protein